LESEVSTEEEDGAYHEDRFCHILRMLTTLLNVSVDNRLATGGISSMSFMIMRNLVAVEKRK
jgi:hypothetical protein